MLKLIKERIDETNDLIYITYLSQNPLIFELDYEKIKDKFIHPSLKEEIIIEAMNPKRICKYLEIEGYDYFDELYGDNF